MHEKELPKNEGMLFVYPNERILKFWMKDTTIPLSIAFIGESGKILDIQDMSPLSETTIKSKSPAKFALEVNRGWFKDNIVKEGDYIDISLFNISESTMRGAPMKFTKKQLNNIIREEISKILLEQDGVNYQRDAKKTRSNLPVPVGGPRHAENELNIKDNYARVQVKH